MINICDSELHWCSGCASEVDSGKTGEYRVLDFSINLKKGQIVSKPRSILCKRCLKDPLVQECLAILESVPKLPKPARPEPMFERIEGAVQCRACNKRITPETPHVSLNISWDVDYKSLTDTDQVLCKDCYSRDKRTQAVWKFLAKLGKNPTFEPRVLCASFGKCATAEKGPFPFQCKFIRVEPRFKRSGRESVQMGYQLACARKHPRSWVVPEDKPLDIKAAKTTSLQKTLKKQAALDPSVARYIRTVLRSVKRMEKALGRTKDPAMKALLQSQIEVTRMLIGPAGYQAMMP